jgi:hypothetical protein
MDRRFFEALSPEARVELLCRLHALAIEHAEKLERDSTNSSRHPTISLTAGTGTPSPFRVQTRQAARQQGDLAVRTSSGRVR